MTAAAYKAAREALGLTQARLAALLGVSERTVIGRENGRRISREAELAIGFFQPGKRSR